jgi:hypothetical protein
MTARSWGQEYEGGLPSAEELLGEPADRSPAELVEDMRHLLGFGDRRVRYRDDGPDVSGLRQELGL